MTLREPLPPVGCRGVRLVLLRHGLLLRNGHKIVVHLLSADHHRLELREVEVLREDEVVLRLTRGLFPHSGVSVAQRSHLLRRHSHVLREHHQVLDGELVVLGDFVHASGHLMLIVIRASSVHSLADVAQLRVLLAEL